MRTLIAQSRRKELQLMRAQETFSDIVLVILSEYLVREYPYNQPRALRGKSLLKVLPKPVPFSEQPAWLQSVPAYHFFEYDSYVEGFEVFEASPRRLDRRYWQALDDLLEDTIALVEQELRPKHTNTTVYLGAVERSLENKKADLYRMLRHWGYHIVPHSPWQQLPDKKEVQKLMEPCRAIVHLLGSEYGTKVPNHIKDIAHLEYEVASQQPNCLQFIWQGEGDPFGIGHWEEGMGILDMLKPSKALAKQYLFNQSFARLKQELAVALSSNPFEKGSKNYIFGVEAIPQGIDWSPIRNIARNRGWKLILFEQQGWKELQQLLGNARVIVVVSEGANPAWVSHWRRLLQKSTGYAQGQYTPEKYWVGQRPENETTAATYLESLAVVAQKLQRQPTA